MKPILKFLGTILRAGVKSVPVGNVIVEAIENRKALKKIKSEGWLEGELKLKTVDGLPTKPHNWISIAIQLIITGSVIYAFFTKQITIDKLIELLNNAF